MTMQFSFSHMIHYYYCCCCIVGRPHGIWKPYHVSVGQSFIATFCHLHHYVS